MLVAPVLGAAVVEVHHINGRVDTGDHHRVVAPGVSVVVLVFDRLSPDEFAVDADDDFVALAQLLFEPFDAAEDAVFALAACSLLVIVASILYSFSRVGMSAKLVPIPEFGFLVLAGVV